MIGFHIQNSPRNWPQAVQRLPAGTPVKFVMGVERCREAKAYNAKVLTWYRWHGEQPMPTANYEEHARAFFNRFIDGTFRREAPYVDFVQEYNEYFGNSQTDAEREHWVQWAIACAKVWQNEYRIQPDLAHIRLILAETAVGNDIPFAVAETAVAHDALLGYHPYIPVNNQIGPPSLLPADDPRRYRQSAPRASFHTAADELYIMKREPLPQSLFPQAFRTDRNEPVTVMPGEWPWYSGRWEAMDNVFRQQGVAPDWIFGETGAVRDASNNWQGWLDPQGGWRLYNALNADMDAYLDVLNYWLNNITTTVAYRQGRVKGGVIFTSGGPGSLWKWFELAQPHMNQVADFVRTYMDNLDNPNPPDNTVPQELWDKSIELQAIQLNPQAALQKVIFRDGFVPVQTEFRHFIDGVEYVAQAGERLSDGARRVYYAVVPNWGDVRWYTSG